jgi:hypothetical protein
LSVNAGTLFRQRGVPTWRRRSSYEGDHTYPRVLYYRAHLRQRCAIRVKPPAACRQHVAAR